MSRTPTCKDILGPGNPYYEAWPWTPEELEGNGSTIGGGA